MKMQIRTTLITSAIAALLAGPVLAATDTSKIDSQSPTKAELGQPERGDFPADSRPMGETQRLGASNADTGSADTGSAGTTARTTGGDNPLYTRPADDLDGMDVVDRTGDKVGDIKQIVLSADRKSAYALISVGGILGMGARDIAVSLDDLRPMDDKLQMSATKEEIEAMKDADSGTDNYVELKGGAPINGSIVEFSAFEQGNEASKPGATSNTPKTDSVKPATTPDTTLTPQSMPETPRAPQ